MKRAILSLSVVVAAFGAGCELLGLAAARCVDDGNCPSDQVCGDDGRCVVAAGEGEGEEGEGEEGEGEEGEGEGEEGEGEGEEGEGEEGEGEGVVELRGVDVRLVSGLAFDSASDVAVAGDGRLFVTAEYTPVNATVGTGANALPLPADTGDDRAAVVAAFAADGRPLWRRVVGGFLALRGAGADPIVVSDDGTIVYVGGRTGSSSVFGFGDADVTDASNAWVAALDAADGAVLWLQTFPSPVRTLTELVLVGDRLVVLGGFEGNDVDFDGTLLSSFGSAGVDLYALGVDVTDGSVAWGRVYGGSGFDQQPGGARVGADVAIAFAADDFVHDGVTPTPVSALTGIVVRLSAVDGSETGRYVDDGGDGDLDLRSLVGFDDGSAWVCGRNDFSAGDDAMLLLRLDGDLGLVRRRRFDGGSCDGIAGDGGGGAIAADVRHFGGVFVDYDGVGVDVPDGNNHSVLVHVDAAGDVTSARVVGGENDVVQSVRQIGTRVVVTGDFRSAFDLDAAHYDPAGESDAFWLLLDFTPAP